MSSDQSPKKLLQLRQNGIKEVVEIEEDPEYAALGKEIATECILITTTQQQVNHSQQSQALQQPPNGSEINYYEVEDEPTAAIRGNCVSTNKPLEEKRQASYSMKKHMRLDKAWISQLDSPPRSTNTEIPPTSYDDCTSIDMSSNGLFGLPHAKLFPSCTKLDLSDNQLTRLSSILPLSKHLTHLDASRNKINNLSNVVSFTALRYLNLSSNQISDIPPYHGSLLQLDLSHNSFQVLPSLISLRLLETLNLSGNAISDLSGASSLFPTSIKYLNLSSNRIDLLTSLYHLTFLPLHSLCIQSNPCILPSKFNHHPFIFALFYTSLVEVDGIALLEEEVLLGERILQDKICKFKREGSEKESEVREYLAVHSPPINSSLHNSSFDTRMNKILEKRREHETSLRSESSCTLASDSRSLSLHSPYSNWASAVLNDKENLSEDISSIATLTALEDEIIVITPSAEAMTHTPTSLLTKPPPLPKPRISRDDNLKRAVVIIQRWWRFHSRSRRHSREEEEERRERVEVIEEVIYEDDEEDEAMRGREDDSVEVDEEEGMEKKEEKRRERIEVIEEEDNEGKKEKMRDDEEKKRMKYTIKSLIKTATVQAECTEKLEGMVNKLTERIHALESLLTPSPPSNLTMNYSPRGLTRLTWTPPPPVDLYEMYVDGRLEGHVSGRSSSVILSNIPPSSSIQLRAVRGSLTSMLSKSVLSD